jgi:hypothetical protein
MPVQTPPASTTLPASAFKSPLIALSGVVDYEMYEKFGRAVRQGVGSESRRDRAVDAGRRSGGARMMGDEVRFASFHDLLESILQRNNLVPLGHDERCF